MKAYNQDQTHFLDEGCGYSSYEIFKLQKY